MKANITVKVRDGDVAQALRRFKEKVKRESVLTAMRRQEFFMKPSEKRRDAIAKGIKKRVKLEKR